MHTDGSGMLLEYCDNGDLLTYLLRLREDGTLYANLPTRHGDPSPSTGQLSSIVLDVATAMEFLCDKKVM
jgi:hypothetical protein